MKHLEVVNSPKALKGKELIHRNIDYYCFEYDSNKREIAIYENLKQWVDKTPGYWITDIVKITCFND